MSLEQWANNGWLRRPHKTSAREELSARDCRTLIPRGAVKR